MGIAIWWIVMIVYIAFVMGKAKKIRNNGKKGTYNTGRNGTNTANAQNRASRPNVAQNKNFAVMPEHKKVPPNVERDCRVEGGHRSGNNIRNGSVSKASAEPNVQRKHAEIPIRSNDNRPVAMRLYEGDHVPRGYRMVKCPYCAAENLIPYSSNAKYKCYFCHTNL